MFISLLIDTDTFDVSLLQHVTAEGTALVQQAEDAASSQVKYYDLFPLSAVNCVFILIRYSYYL